MQYPILSLQINYVDKERFVEYWGSQYQYGNESEYLDNIGKEPTEERVLALFTWKNGRTLSQGKIRTIRSHFLPNQERFRSQHDLNLLRPYLCRPGGAIWRIFWLHVQYPGRYPIFDQHVYRAMAKLRRLPSPEIPSSDREKVNLYLDAYLPFWKELQGPDPRKVNRALHTYGKYLFVDHHKTGA